MKKRRDDIHTTPDVTHIHNPEVAHEASDVNIKAILQFTFGLVVIGLLIPVLIWGLLKILDSRETKKEAKTKPGPMALSPNERLPKEPRLQAAPGFGDDLNLGNGKNLELMAPNTEYNVLNDRWRAVLAHGQKDPTTGAVTAIPIAEAKKRLIQEGIKSRPGADAGNGYQKAMEIPALSSGGRTMELRRQ